MTPKRRADITDALYVIWALLTYALAACSAPLDEKTYRNGVLLWLAVTLPALGCVAYAAIRVLLAALPRGKRS